MRRLLVALAAALTAAGSTSFKALAADSTDVGALTIHATGFANSRGHAIVKLFAPGDNVLGAGRWQVASVIEGGAAEFRILALPPGRYAAVVFHDLNDNSVIDHGLFGPSEPLGFSGKFVLSLVSGRPDFERLQFDFKPPAQTLEVRLR